MDVFNARVFFISETSFSHNAGAGAAKKGGRQRNTSGVFFLVACFLIVFPGCALRRWPRELRCHLCSVSRDGDELSRPELDTGGSGKQRRNCATVATR